MHSRRGNQRVMYLTQGSSAWLQSDFIREGIRLRVSLETLLE